MIVCQMTSVHQQEDIRIFHKECISLVNAGYDTYLVSCGKTYDKSGVHIQGVRKPNGNRVLRIIVTARQVFKRALEIDADIYHFHDPELLPYGLKLKRLGKKVIFDSHEDVPAQIMDKAWIPKPMRKIVSFIYKTYESHVVKHLDAVVAATPHIAESFFGRCKKVVVVNNYPKLDDIAFHATSFTEREAIVVYAGGIDDLRGEKIMIEAIKDVDAQLIIAGDHEVMEMGGGKIRYLGLCDRKKINDLYGTAIAGLCILKPIKNYYYSRPIKVYEYMAAGLPYICSDFPGWRRVSEESGAGICVNPDNTAQISNAIKWFISNREQGQAMGRLGREYVISSCNWGKEEKGLLSLYDAIGV